MDQVLVVAEPSERLAYTLDIVFRRLLGLDFRQVSSQDVSSSEKGPCVVYGDGKMDINPNVLAVPSLGLLYEKGIRPTFEPIREKADGHVLFEIDDSGAFDLHFDVFSAVFYLATEYEKYAVPLYDSYGRYDEQQYPTITSGLYQKPWIHLWAEQLYGLLLKKWPHLKRKQKAFRINYTFDIDNPWKYLHKGSMIFWGGFVKSLIRGDILSLKERIQSFTKGQDPNDTFEEIFAHFPQENTQFFILLDRHHPHDTRFTYAHPGFRSLIQTIKQEGYSIGIHPSYTSYLDRSKIAFEKEKLEEIIEESVHASRQHYLRYRLPHTFRHLLSAGLSQDYSVCLYHDIGFRTGVCIPYPWFDLENNIQTSLTVYPTLAMDVTLQQYQELAAEEACRRLERLKDQVEAVGGDLRLLFHNEILSDSGAWKGWKKPILSLVDAWNKRY